MHNSFNAAVRKGRTVPTSIKTRMVEMCKGKLTKSQSKLLGYFETVDPQRVIYMSITDLAEETGVAEATLLRFCRALGFNGYQEFRLNLAQGVIDIGGAQDGAPGFMAEIQDSYRFAMENCRKSISANDLKAAQELILSARSVSCFGAGHSHLAARELHNRLMSMGVLTHIEQSAHLQNVLISAQGEEDVLVLFSMSGSSKDILEAAELARANGMKLIVITSYAKSPLTKYADVVLCTAPIESPKHSGSIAGKIAQLYTVDVLCTAIYLTDKTRFDTAIAKSRRATVGKLI